MEQCGKTGDRLGGFRADVHIELGGKAHSAAMRTGSSLVAFPGSPIRRIMPSCRIFHAADVVAHGKISRCNAGC